MREGDAMTIVEPQQRLLDAVWGQRRVAHRGCCCCFFAATAAVGGWLASRGSLLLRFFDVGIVLKPCLVSFRVKRLCVLWRGRFGSQSPFFEELHVIVMDEDDVLQFCKL
jgi:hypothetical protein